jgi:hypothetical protein
MNKDSMEARMYTTFCSDFNLKPEWLGKTFTNEKGKAYTVSGLNPRSKKFPVLTKEGTQFNGDYLIAIMTNTLDKLEQKRKDAHEKKTAAMLKKARATFPVMSKTYNIPATWLDKTFKHGRKVYTLVGWSDEKLRFPFVAQANDGKVLFFSEELIRELTSKQAA